MRALRRFAVCLMCAAVIGTGTRGSHGQQARAPRAAAGSLQRPWQNLPPENITVRWAGAHRDQLFEIVKQLVKSDQEAIAAIENSLKGKRVTDQIDYLTGFIQRAVERGQ